MDRGRGSGLTVYLTLALSLLALGTIGLIGGWGLFPLTAGVALLIGAPFRARPWVVAGLVAGAVVFSATYLLTAPLACSETAGTGSGRRPVVVTTCSRVALADLDRQPRAPDYLLAVSLAAGAAVVAGAGIALLASRVGRSTR